jgi:isopenicillin N synthase-like dioxygenase
MGEQIQRVPTIDIRPFFRGSNSERATVASQVSQACQDLGFLIITGCEVPITLIRQTHSVSFEFFALPEAEKEEIAIGRYSRLNGFIGIHASTLANLADRDELSSPQQELRQSLHIGPFDFPDDEYFRGPVGQRYFQPNPWPQNPKRLKPIFCEYYRAMERVADHLMRIMALALDLPEFYFADKTDKCFSHLLVNNYPEQESPPAANETRASAHTDFNSFTILHLGDEPEGLEVLDKDGTWRPVTSPYDAFVVNLGDMMARWTNDAWVSTMHRVVNPPASRAARSRRQSLVFFHQPNYDAVIERIESCKGSDRPAKCPAITSDEYYDIQMAKVLQS